MYYLELVVVAAFVVVVSLLARHLPPRIRLTVGVPLCVFVVTCIVLIGAYVVAALAALAMGAGLYVLMRGARVRTA